MIDKTWLNDYIEQMEYEVQENEKDRKDIKSCSQSEIAPYVMSEENGELECPEDYYCLGLCHGEQKGVLDTLKLIKGKL